MNNAPNFSSSPGAVALVASGIAAVVGLACYATGSAPGVATPDVGTYCPELGRFVKSEQA